nr:PH domain-containing protein [uncultured Campylobacter sp.]
MGYVESNLLNGENVIAKAKIHRAVFISAIIILIPAIVGIINKDDRLSFICFGGFIAALIHGFIVLKTNELAITNQRIIGKAGFVSRDTVELKYEKIESLSVAQGVLGRIFGCGTVVVRGTGGTAVSFPYITNPVAFKNKAMEKIG